MAARRPGTGLALAWWRLCICSLLRDVIVMAAIVEIGFRMVSSLLPLSCSRLERGSTVVRTATRGSRTLPSEVAIVASGAGVSWRLCRCSLLCDVAVMAAVVELGFGKVSSRSPCPRSPGSMMV